MRKIGLWALLLMWAPSALAQSIAATVNDTPISTYDVAQRVRLMQLMRPSQGEKAALEQEALEQLINDTLKIQEGAKNNFSVSKEELVHAIQRLEEQNQMPASSLEKELSDRGISKAALEQQLKADLMWLQVLRQYKGSMPEITDQMIQNRMAQIKNDLAKERFLVAEILVKDRAEADRVFEEIKNGSQFDVVAKRQSVAKSAEKGGFLGWIDADYYENNVMAIVRQMQPNQLSKPIQSSKGYYVLLLLDHKKAMPEQITVWELAQLAVLPTQTLEALPQLSALSECAAFEEWGQKNALPDSAKRGFVNTQQLPPELVDLLQNKKMNTLVGPVSMGQADLFFMKCQEQERSLLPSEEEVRSQLEVEQMMLLTDRLMRDIKRYAVIEYKE